MEWFIYALLAPALWALNNIFIKFLITNKFRTYVPMISTLTFMDLLFVISTLAIVPFTFNFPYTIYAIMVGLMPVIAFWFYSKALLIEEVSRIITLFQLIPLFVTLFSVIFLNEILGFEKYLGIAIIVSASLLISSKKIEGKYSFSDVFKYIIPFGLIIATYTIIEKWLLNYFEFWSLFFWNIMGAFMGILVLLSFRKPRKQFINTLPIIGVKGLLTTFIGEGIYVSGALFSLLALSAAEVSIVSALFGLQPFFIFFYTILLSSFLPNILREQMNKKVIVLKIIAITLMFTGTYLIV